MNHETTGIFEQSNYSKWAMLKKSCIIRLQYDEYYLYVTAREYPTTSNF